MSLNIISFIQIRTLSPAMDYSSHKKHRNSYLSCKLFSSASLSWFPEEFCQNIYKLLVCIMFPGRKIFLFNKNINANCTQFAYYIPFWSGKFCLRRKSLFLAWRTVIRMLLKKYGSLFFERRIFSTRHQGVFVGRKSAASSDWCVEFIFIKLTLTNSSNWEEELYSITTSFLYEAALQYCKEVLPL